MSHIGTTDYSLQVARGLVEDAKVFDKFGYNGNQSAASGFFTIWNGAAAWIPMTAADTLNIVSASISDDGSPVGIGARTVTIIGTDGSGDFQQVDYTMNGTTPVTTGESWKAVNRVFVKTAGSTGWNVGNLTISETTSGNVQAVIIANDSITHQLFYTVENGSSAYIERIYLSTQRASGGALPTVKFNMWKSEAGVITRLFPDMADAGIDPVLDQEIKNTIKIAPGGFWWIESDTTNNNTFIRGRITQKIIVDN